MNKATEPRYSEFRIGLEYLVHRGPIRLYGPNKLFQEFYYDLSASGALVIDEIDKIGGG